jgi:ABC-type phosphate transport system substrate-binding protein
MSTGMAGPGVALRRITPVRRNTAPGRNAVHRLGMTTAVAAAVLAFGLAACGGDPADPTVGREAQVLQAREVLSISDSWSGFQAPTRVVISNAQAWADAWATIHALYTVPPALPAVDFSTSVLILAAMGPQSSTGYSVAIQEVRVDDGALAVTVLERSPGASCVTGQAVTSPVHVVEVPRHATTASFTVNSVTYAC